MRRISSSYLSLNSASMYYWVRVVSSPLKRNFSTAKRGLAALTLLLLLSISATANTGTEKSSPAPVSEAEPFWSESPTSEASAIPVLSSSDGIVHFTLLHTNDEHAALVPSPQSEARLPGAQSTGGIARIAHIIAEIRERKSAQNEPVLVVSAGDFISGSPFSWLVLQNEAPELRLMIEAGYDIITLGNHEFDYGPDRLSTYLTRAGYPSAAEKTPIVATNTVIPENHILQSAGIRETYIRTLPNGLRVGFFGLMGKHADTVAPMAVPVSFSDQHSAAQRAVAALQAEGAQIIVLLSHSGEDEDIEIARAVPGIHVIIGGHMHTVLREPIFEGETIIVQTGTEFNYIGMLELAYHPETGRVSMRNRDGFIPAEGAGDANNIPRTENARSAEGYGNPEDAGKATSRQGDGLSSGTDYLNPMPGSYLIAVNERVPEDPRIAMQLKAYSDKLSLLVSDMTRGMVTEFNQTIARSAETLVRSPQLSETPLGNFVTDAMRLAASEATGRPVDFVFEASGVIRGDLTPGRHPLNPDAVTFYDLASVIGLGSGPDELPGYPMVSVYFTGEEVRRVLEITILLSQIMGNTYYLQNSGLRVEYDPARSVWFRIPFKGTPLPSGRAVLRAERYTGPGIPRHDSDTWVALERGDETLYHVVSDYYNASFLPMVGEVLPSFKLVMKDETGNPVELADRIIYRDGQELKVWQAVTEYVLMQPLDPADTIRLQNDTSTSGSSNSVDNDNLPRIDPAYASLQGRMVKVEGPPLIPWKGILFVGVILAAVVVILRRRKS
jgi:5'-nucleotidase / UDP-sugar diphosphatase